MPVKYHRTVLGPEREGDMVEGANCWKLGVTADAEEVVVWREPAKEKSRTMLLHVAVAVVQALAGKKAVAVGVDLDIENVPKFDGHRQVDYDK